MARVREYWGSLDRNKKIFSIFSASILTFLIGYGGIGYIVWSSASQALAVNPGCGMWAENTPSDWTVDDDWESFEPIMDFIHKNSGAYLVWVLIAAHAGAALYHHYIRKDDVLKRMIKFQQ